MCQVLPLLFLLLAPAAPFAGQQRLALEEIPTGLFNVDWVQVTFAPGDDANRIFALRKSGDIHIFENDVRLPAPFLDLNYKIYMSSESGLLGMAFHPDYRRNGYFYVSYTDRFGRGAVIERYQADPNDPNRAIPDSGQLVIQPGLPVGQHNAGWLGFGPDGFLYVPLGDGGSSARSQDGNDLKGKILRLDVDHPAAGLNYGIPASNPFVQDPNVRDEIWALGLRNPWRCDFDAETGDLWITDVGLASWEEVNFQPAGAGGSNYGWSIMEGAHCQDPPANCNQTGLTLPIYKHDHFGSPHRCAIIGGVLYRGRQMADMHGRFFFADHCSRQVTSFRHSAGGIADLADHTDDLLLPGGSRLYYPLSLGEDAAGEIYITTYDDERLHRIVPRGLRLRMPRLIAGGQAAIPVTGGAAGGLTGLFFSRSGLGSTAIPPAQVILGIRQAQLLAAQSADDSGATVFHATIPPSLQNRTLWLQAAQVGAASNIAVETVD